MKIKPLLFTLVLVVAAAAQPKPGKWYCIEALYEGNAVEDFDAVFEILDQEYYEASFKKGSETGRVKSLFTFSPAKDTLYSELTTIAPFTYSSGSSWGTKLYYEFSLRCSQELWEKVGQIALGWGIPPAGRKKCFILIETRDSLLVLRSWNRKTQLTYTHGAKRAPHNPVIFVVNMDVQLQLGNFKPQAGDTAAVEINLPEGNLRVILQRRNSTNIYEGEYDFTPTKVGSEIVYRFSRWNAAAGEWVAEREPRRFTHEGGKIKLPVVFFDQQTNVYPLADIAVIENEKKKDSPAAAYDIHKKRWLIVWRETTDNPTAIWGRFIDQNGPMGEPFEIFNNGTYRLYNPQIEYLAGSRRYMVVWSDRRVPKMDIYGILLDAEGGKVLVSRSLAGGEFVICNHDSSQYSPKISYNKLQKNILCAWVDGRNARVGEGGWLCNSDIYGRLLNENGDFIAPGDPNDSRFALPIAVSPDYEETMPDAAYLGMHGGTKIDEWLVVYLRYAISGSEIGIWGVRLDGADGSRLDTWGRPAGNKSLLKAAERHSPPWLPEFPISAQGNFGNMQICSTAGGGYAGYMGSPHVAANDETYDMPDLPTRKHINPLPECMVVWTAYQGTGADIMGQRVSYFPDAEAFARGIKPRKEADTLCTVVLLDQKGKPADTGSWKTWPDFPICVDPYNQEYNGIDYNQQDGTFLAVWNDYRSNQWDGSWGSEPNWYPPPADLYGQKLRVMPKDTLWTLIDESGNPEASPLVNTLIVGSEANEGMYSYPAVAYGMHTNEFCVAYRYAAGSEQSNIHATLFNGKSTVPEKEPDTHVSANGSVVSFALHQNFPNPFNPSTEIRFSLSRTAPIRLSIYNSLGQLVTVLCDRSCDAGEYRLSWNGTDYDNRPVSGGIYFCRLESGNQIKTIKMALVK